MDETEIRGPGTAWSSQTVLEGSHLTFDYPSLKRSPPHRVFENVTVNVGRNELVALVGSTGVGKSTLLRCLGGFLTPSAGHVYLHGSEVRHPSSRIGLIHQSIATFPWMTALKNVKLALACKDISEEEATRIAADKLELVGLGAHLNSYPKEMSGGMRQKVAIARALAADPSVLLMDEPFVHLDEISSAQLRREIYSIVFNPDSTLEGAILVSHNLNEVVELADRVYVIRGSPARVGSEFRIDLPRPRAWRDSSFLLNIDQLREHLGDTTVAP